MVIVKFFLALFMTAVIRLIGIRVTTKNEAQRILWTIQSHSMIKQQHAQYARLLLFRGDMRVAHLNINSSLFEKA